MKSVNDQHGDYFIVKKLLSMVRAGSISEPLRTMLIEALSKQRCVPSFQELKSHIDSGKLPPELVLSLLQSGFLNLATGIASKSPAGMALGSKELALLAWGCSQASIDSEKFQEFTRKVQNTWRRHRYVSSSRNFRDSRYQTDAGGSPFQVPKEAIFVASGIITGVGVSTISAAPAVIAVGAIAGYKGSELIYENKEKIIDFFRGDGAGFAESSDERDEWQPVPGFLSAT